MGMTGLIMGIAGLITGITEGYNSILTKST